MTTEPRVALNTLIQAFEEHLNALAAKRGENDATVEQAYLGIADAFEVYEDALYVTYDEVTPLEVFVEDDDDESDDDDDLDELEGLEDLYEGEDSTPEDDDDEDPENQADPGR